MSFTKIITFLANSFTTRIGVTEVMTAQTFFLSRVFSRQTFSAQYVRLVRNWFKVTRAHTRFTSALVIEFSAFTNFLSAQLIRKNVSENDFVTHAETAIPLIAVSRPNPARFCLSYFAPKAFHGLSSNTSAAGCRV